MSAVGRNRPLYDDEAVALSSHQCALSPEDAHPGARRRLRLARAI